MSITSISKLDVSKNTRVSSGSTESVLKVELETLSEENGRLKSRIDQLVKEAMEMKSTIYDLNLKLQNNGSESVFSITKHPSFEDLSESKISKDTQLNYKFQLKGHNGAVYSCKFSPNGKYILSTSFDKTCFLWDFEKKAHISTLKGHEMCVLDGKWSFDGNFISTGSIDATAKVWNVATSQQVSNFEARGFVQSIVWQNNDIFYCCDTKKNIFGFDKRIRDPILHYVNTSTVNSLVIDENSNILYFGDNSGTLASFDVKQGAILETFATNSPISHISKLDQYISVNCYDNTCKIIEKSQQFSQFTTFTNNMTKNWPIKNAMNASFIASGSNEHYAKVYRRDSDQVQILKGHSDIVFGVDFHPTQNVLTTCSGDGNLQVYG